MVTPTYVTFRPVTDRLRILSLISVKKKSPHRESKVFRSTGYLILFQHATSGALEFNSLHHEVKTFCPKIWQQNLAAVIESGKLMLLGMRWSKPPQPAWLFITSYPTRAPMKMHILLTILRTFLMKLVRRICLNAILDDHFLYSRLFYVWTSRDDVKRKFILVTVTD